MPTSIVEVEDTRAVVDSKMDKVDVSVAVLEPTIVLTRVLMLPLLSVVMIVERMVVIGTSVSVLVTLKITVSGVGSLKVVVTTWVTVPIPV
jgi:hypothetical protein